MNEEITKQISFTEEVEALKGVLLTETCPITGRIKSVIMSFPDGCNMLVDVAFGHGSEKTCPYNDYIALDDATPVYTGINEPVKMNEKLWCEIRNTDGQYSHRISVLVVIVGRFGDMEA